MFPTRQPGFHLPRWCFCHCNPLRRSNCRRLRDTPLQATCPRAWKSERRRWRSFWAWLKSSLKIIWLGWTIFMYQLMPKTMTKLSYCILTVVYSYVYLPNNAPACSHVILASLLVTAYWETNTVWSPASMWVKFDDNSGKQQSVKVGKSTASTTSILRNILERLRGVNLWVQYIIGQYSKYPFIELQRLRAFVIFASLPVE